MATQKDVTVKIIFALSSRNEQKNLRKPLESQNSNVTIVVISDYTYKVCEIELVS